MMLNPIHRDRIEFMSALRLVSEPNATDDEQQVIRDAINTFNMVKANDRNYSPLHIFVRDDTGAILGGILGDIWGGWLHITYLWVAPELRGQGYGTRLLGAAEDEARGKGCRGAFCETFSFQAPEFYARNGYQTSGQINEYPPGEIFFFLWKLL